MEVTVRDRIFEPYISEEELSKKIEIVANQINKEYDNCPCEKYPVFIITLSGALFFSAELLKKIKFLPKIGFIKCSSYTDNLTSSGKIIVKIEPTIDVKDKEVIVLEDIVDTGLTWKFMYDYFLKLGARKVRIASMFYKETSVDNIPPVDWFALKDDSKFIIGTGLDYGEIGRNIPGIFKLKE